MIVNYPIDIWTAFEAAGGVLKQGRGISQMVNCVFHDDRIPSAKIYPETETYVCFACRINYDVRNFWKRWKGLETEPFTPNKLLVLVDVFESEILRAIKQSEKRAHDFIEIFDVLDKCRILLKENKVTDESKLWDWMVDAKALIDKRISMGI